MRTGINRILVPVDSVPHRMKPSSTPGLSRVASAHRSSYCTSSKIRCQSAA
jgi:hypothetical protein